MPKTPFGHLTVIANPAARSGRGALGAAFVEEFLRTNPACAESARILRTSAPGDAQRMAAQATDADTLAVLGGDGVIHEAVCGLMSLPKSERPALVVLPLGSGNDYARTLGLARNDVKTALEQALGGSVRTLDAGRVNGTYFMQTLSFGLDAAIALDTTTRRANETSQKGALLFATSGLKVFSQVSKGFPSVVSFDGERPQRLDTLVFAAQVGPTYGGGFRICPNADPQDGLLSVCYNERRASVPHLLALFGLARGGKHTASRIVHLRTARCIDIDFEREPPAQADGEKLTGTHFEIESIPQALRVIVPEKSR